jgi:hypothetical protein
MGGGEAGQILVLYALGPKKVVRQRVELEDGGWNIGEWELMEALWPCFSLS